MITKRLNKVYFLGIGGIGMSSLARYLNTAGTDVSGYDKTQTVLTNKLVDEGIAIHYEDLPENIPIDVDLVVYTPAIPSDLKEFIRIKELGLPLLKRSELLEKISSDHRTLAVAGTHGKTTVSTMLAHIMYQSKAGCTAFLGGISKNYSSNLLLNNKSEFMVTEADEFDRSFLRLHPTLAIITSADADHLDIYGSHEELLDSFAQFASKVKEDGILLIKSGLKLKLPERRTYYYSITGNADFSIKDLKLIDGFYNFTIQTPQGEIRGLKPDLPGLFNVENALAAASAAWLSGASTEEIVQSINNFKGVRRRFDRIINRPDFLYIDDYAHHPEELRACLTAVRKLYSLKKITGIFQPHLYTRTRDFANEFAESLSMLDTLILLDIYPARELPIEGVSSKMLLDITPLDSKMLLSKHEVLEYLHNNKPEILLTLGAGDIDQLVPKIEKIFT